MYILEGNIGAGKSTFLRLIAQQIPEITVILEPVHNWQDTGHGQSLLANFYEDSNRWAYTFEALTMMCRAQDHLSNQQKNGVIKIAERSVYSGYYCFAQNSFSQGFLTPLEWEIYQQWFSLLIPRKCLPPKGFIYLRVTPEVAYERIQNRNRSAEKTVSLEYLKQIHDRHEAMLTKKEGILPHLKKVPVLTLNVDDEFESNPAQLHRHMHAIQTFLTQAGEIVPPYKQKHMHP